MRSTVSELLPRCTCGSVAAELQVYYGIPVLRCSACGVRRQSVNMTLPELAEWYRAQYHSGVYGHSYSHDVEVAHKRLKYYCISTGTKLLDVGAGNGAFVDTAIARGIDAVGQDLAETGEDDVMYRGDLMDVAFPTDSFDVVTMHDVLEHVPDPMAMLREVRRILRRPGKLFIDFPSFWVSEGRHHWKRNEHLWMFTVEQLCELLREAGFRVSRVSHPIQSKVLFEAEPTPDNRPQVLVPAGIGDAYWALTKLPGLMRREGITAIPDVWVQDSGGPRRTQPFLRNVPSVNAAGYLKLSDRDPLFHEAYMRNGRTIFPDVLGVDYFVAYNGVLRAGRKLEDVDPDLGCDWYPKLHVSKAAAKMREQMTGPGRPYILTYWAEAGMYRHWLSDFPATEICRALRTLRDRLDCRIVFMGSPWDRGQVGKAIAEMDDSFECLIGGTSFDQMLGLIQGASAVVGYPAGNTILATMLGVPTVLLWNRYFKEEFWMAACPPDANYTAVDTRGLNAEMLYATVTSRMAMPRPRQ